jgi:hypothetical protein
MRGLPAFAIVIGAVRELVSRNLSCFQAEEPAKLEGKKVIVSDRTRLEAKVEAEE